MAQGWHYGGLIGQDPRGGTGGLRTSGVRAVADAGQTTGGLPDSTLISDETIAVNTADTVLTFDHGYSFGGAAGGTSNDGSTVLVGANQGFSWYELSTPYDFSTRGTRNNKNFFGDSGNDSAYNQDYRSPYFAPNGMSIICAGSKLPYQTIQIPLTQAYNPATASLTHTSVTGSSQYQRMSPDGTKIFGGSDTSAPIKTMSTPGDITTISTTTLSSDADAGVSGYALVPSSTVPICDITGKRWFGMFERSSDSTFHFIAGTSAAAHAIEAITWDTTKTYNIGTQRNSWDFAINADHTRVLFAYRDSNSNQVTRSLALADLGKPTQRWGRQLGRSPFVGTALRNTGIITTPEAYQLKL